jgi:hypothetical protein
MRDLALRAAGALGILVAVAHGIIAELRVFPNAHIDPKRTKDLLREVWQASTVDWIAIGALLIVAPALDQAPRLSIIAVAVVMYGYAAIGNAVATRGRHVGWCLMAAAVALALLGH